MKWLRNILAQRRTIAKLHAQNSDQECCLKLAVLAQQALKSEITYVQMELFETREALRDSEFERAQLRLDLGDARDKVAVLTATVQERDALLRQAGAKLAKFAVKPRGEGGKFLPGGGRDAH